jgi:hypothetical protein
LHLFGDEGLHFDEDLALGAFSCHVCEVSALGDAVGLFGEEVVEHPQVWFGVFGLFFYFFDNGFDYFFLLIVNSDKQVPCFTDDLIIILADGLFFEYFLNDSTGAGVEFVGFLDLDSHDFEKFEDELVG